LFDASPAARQDLPGRAMTPRSSAPDPGRHRWEPAAELRRQLRTAADTGAAVVLICTDLDELLSLSRTTVLHSFGRDDPRTRTPRRGSDPPSR